MTDETTDVRHGAGAAGGTARRTEEVTVLVVDDEPDVVSYFSSVLEDAGMKVLVAYDGDQAMEVLGANHVDLISLDLVMPRKSGIRLFMELRRTPDWSKIPIVFVTGHAKDPDLKKDITAAMADSTMVGPSLCLEKPVTPESYLNHICNILGVKCPEDTEEADRAEELRREARALLETADSKTIEALLDRLKRVGR
jgi:CheY-like chemotaxis protein